MLYKEFAPTFLISVCNVAIKRRQKKACFHFAEREQHRRWLNLF